MKITFYHLIVLALGLAGCSGLSDTRTSAACPSHQTSGSAAPSAGSFQVAAATDIQGVSPSAGSEFGEAEPLEFLEEEVPPDTIADPLEPINRVFFHFNDKLYFWALKPAASGYRKVLPEGVRISVRNFFSNLATPIRFANCLFQAKFKGAGIELSRCVVNTTLGVGGLFDPAGTCYNLKRQDEDFGQTLGVYRMGPGFYINWPVLGPSSVRGTAGFVGDIFLDPLTYLLDLGPERLGAEAGDRVNETSLTIGEYEDLKDAALDPYVALRNAYYQHRKSKIEQ